MARIPIIMPKMSMTMTEGEVASWMVKVGDEIAEGDVIAEVMTDKVDMEVESTHSGTLVEITVDSGMVNVGDPIGYLEGTDSGFGDLLGGGEAEAPPEPAEDRAPEPAAGQAADTDATPDVGGDVPADPPVPGREDTGPGTSPAPPPAPTSAPTSAPSSAPTPPAPLQVDEVAPPPPGPDVDVEAHTRASTRATTGASTGATTGADGRAGARSLTTAAVPRARGLARERGLDLASVRGTGPEGLVTVADVEAAVAPQRGAAPADTVQPPAPQPAGPAAPRSVAEAAGRARGKDRAGKIRAAVARKMVESASVPQFTVWRDLVLDDADVRRHGLSWTTVLLQAYAAAMRDVPDLLCRWDGEEAVPSGPPSVALAVATELGLMVPVFTEPDRAAPRELDAEVKSVVSAVQQGRLDPAYLGVANGSLSNLGGLGVDRFQALVTPPQASVLSLGSIRRRPVAVPGGVGLALTLTAGLTVDHRVADGAHAATLLDRFAAHVG